jgi:glycosyltransferase involved in cell wall biosynthesis
MRILIISTFFPPLNSIASLRPYSFAKYFSKEGHDVTVLTTLKGGCHAPLDLSFEGFKVIEVSQNKIVDQAKGVYQEKKRSFLSKSFDTLRKKLGIFSACRMPDFSQTWIKPAVLRIQQEAPFDVVVSTSGPFIVHFVAHRVKKSGWAKKWVADFRDLWCDNHIYPGLFPFTLVEKYYEKKFLKCADLVTTVSEPLKTTLEKKRKGVHVIENGFDPEDLQNLCKDSVFAKDGRVRIVHTGSIYYGKQDPEPLFQAIAAIAETDPALVNSLEVILVGPNQEPLLSLVEKYKISHLVRLGGLVDRKESLRMQRDADFLLFLPWNDVKEEGILTGKLFEYLFSNTPILAFGGSKLDGGKKLISEMGAGFCFEFKEQDALKAFLVKALKERKKVSLSHFCKLKKFTREELANKLLQLMEALC